MEIPNPESEDQGKSLVASSPPIMVLLLLLVAIFLCSMLGSLMLLAITEVQGIDLPSAIEQLEAGSTPAERNFIRFASMIGHLMAFAIPALLLAFMLYRRQWASELRLDQSPGLTNLTGGVFLIIFSFPLAQLTLWLNQQLPLPDWALSMEDTTENLIQNLLIMESPQEFLLTMLLVGVLPAIGEELVFRGFVQPKLSEQFGKPVAAIWITAVLFSAIHLQFEGFLPRMILGALLGYLYYWTRNLWAPIVGHFAFNGSQVAAQYFYRDELLQMQTEQSVQANWTGGIISLVLVLITGYYLQTINKEN